MQIGTGLLGRLTSEIDEDMLYGTFPTLDMVKAAEAYQDAPTNSRAPSTVASKVVGRPLDLDDLDEVKEKIAHVDIYDLDSSDDEATNEITASFTFSKNITNPKDVLTGPPLSNLQASDYLVLVGKDTDTECTLEGREVRIVGTDADQVKEAVQRFQNIQTLYKRRRRPTNVVPCVHYPTQSAEYGLYFCNLNRYKHKAFVDLLYHDSLRPMHVLLPVFRHPKTGAYQKPKDLLNVPEQSVEQERPIPPRPTWVQQSSSSSSTNAQHRRSLPNTHSNMEAPLWGENRAFINNYASLPSTPSPTSRAQQQQSPPREDFPALPNNRRYVPVKEPTPQPHSRRVLRLTSQQADAAVHQPHQNLLEMAKVYNLNNMQTALTEGLEGLRGFKGEIQLEAKLGKVLWTNLASDIQKKIWEFRDIKDLVVKEHGVKPVFNDLTTASEDIIQTISEILPKPFNHTGCFEIHAQARNQPTLEYKPVIMIMNQGIVELRKVITRKTKVTEIDWVSLDRKFDFQMSLSCQELGRVDVRPYSTFIKKVSVCPITNQMTFENVRDFLKVDHILHKQKTRYRIHFPFIVEITRVERIPLKPQPTTGYGVEKILGMTGKGQVWYDLQVYYTNHDEPFRSNLGVSAGKLASWTVDDILGPKDQPQTLVEYVKCLLLLIEKCEPLFS
ncbi:hypothetical protein BJV82DRAFT_630303 [Fennellomyces sp. T-0311]|nr:hypothetical protein BJV82DRAFT_630303 [Fennellomyces sp. T-0311]